jgi:membrane protein
MNRDNKFLSKIPFKGRLGKLYRDWHPRIPEYRGRARQLLNRIFNPEDLRVAILTRSIRRFNKNLASEASAAISFYSLLSLVPLLIFVVSIASLLFSQSVIEQRLLATLGNNFPLAPNFVSALIQNLINSRVAVNLIAIVFLVWSASGMFTTILININRVWDIQNVISMIKSRLVAIALILGLVVIVLFSLLIPAFLSFLHLQGLVRIYQALVELMPFLMRFLVILGLYRIGPVVQIQRKTAIRAAFIVSLVGGLFTRLFAWYMNGLSGFETFYGSLGVFIGLLMWVYFGNYILLMGVYLMEAIEFYSTGKSEATLETASILSDGN